MSTAVDTAPPDRASGWDRLRAVAVALGIVAAAILLGLVLTIAVFVPLAVLGVGLDGSQSVLLVAGLVPSQLAFAVVGVLAGLTLLDGIPARVPTRRDLRWVGLGLAGCFTAVGIMLVAATFVDLRPLQSVYGEAASVDPRVLVVLAVMSIVVIAPAEEVLFRGAVQGRLRRTFGPAGAIGVTSLVFASLHAFNFVGGGLVVLVPLAALFLVGSVLGYVYERSENLVVPVAVHALYNATLFLSSFVLG